MVDSAAYFGNFHKRYLLDDYTRFITMEEVLREYIKENLAQGIIRHSQSPLGAPILFTEKKDASLRLCIDYRGLNNMTKKEPHPLPAIESILRQLGGAKLFTKIDLTGACNLLRIK